MTDRIPCVVPFCRRTAPYDEDRAHQEIICGKHWRMIDRRWRRRHTFISRILTKLEPAEVKNPRKVLRVAEKIWAACKRQAIERAAGITA
jgi:hypothetical protein